MGHGWRFYLRALEGDVLTPDEPGLLMHCSNPSGHCRHFTRPSPARYVWVCGDTTSSGHFLGSQNPNRSTG